MGKSVRFSSDKIATELQSVFNSDEWIIDEIVCKSYKNALVINAVLNAKTYSYLIHIQCV